MTAAHALTVRELQIVARLQRGARNRDIAAALHLTEGTIRVYVWVACRKAGVPNRTALAVWAFERFGVIEYAANEV